MAAKKKGPSMRENQQRKLTMQKIAKGGPQLSGVKKPAPSAGRRINPKAAKPKPPAPKPSTPSGGGRNLFGGAGNKPAAITKADSQKAPKPAFRTSRAPFSSTGKPTRPSLGNVRPGPAAAAAPRQQAQAQGQANVRAAQQRRQKLAVRQQLAAASRRMDMAKGGTGAALVSGALNAPAELKKLQALLRNPKGALSRASSDIMSGKAYDPQTVPKASKPATRKLTTPKGPTAAQRKDFAAQETKARQALSARKKATGSKEATPNTAASFDDAFKDARRAKVKTFTWRGKKYTTEMK